MTPETRAAASCAASFFIDEFSHGEPSATWLQQAFRAHHGEGDESEFAACVIAAIRAHQAQQACAACVTSV